MAWPTHAFATSAKESDMNHSVGCRGAGQAIRTTIGDERSVRTAHPTLEATYR